MKKEVDDGVWWSGTFAVSNQTALILGVVILFLLIRGVSGLIADLITVFS